MDGEGRTYQVFDYFPQQMCVRTILGVSRYQQWQERLSTRTVAGMFGMALSIPDLVMDRRLQWLGHLGRMGEGRLPRRCFMVS